MPHAWELVVSWCGEPIRAELLEGRVRVDGGGPSLSDLPLPIEGRTPLVRGAAGTALTLLAPAEAAWTIDGRPAGARPVLEGDGVARLAVGGVEVALQRTTPARRFPRFAPMGGALLSAATFTAAYALIGLTLATESPETCACRPPRIAAASPATPTFEALARSASPRPRDLPRWLRVEPAPPPVEAQARAAVTPAAPAARARRARRAAPIEVPVLAPADGVLDLSGAVLGSEIVRVEDLDLDERRTTRLEPNGGPAPPGPGVRSGSPGGVGRSRGGIGSCDGQHFAALAARHGRQIAIVACAPAPELGQAPAGRPGHNVVLRERDGSRLAPEVWTWSTSRR